MLKSITSLLILITVSVVNGQTNNLQDFYNYNATIEHRVDEIFETLTDTSRVAQMIVTSAGELGKPNKTVLKLARENKIGGVVFLKL